MKLTIENIHRITDYRIEIYDPLDSTQYNIVCRYTEETETDYLFVMTSAIYPISVLSVAPTYEIKLCRDGMTDPDDEDKPDTLWYTLDYLRKDGRVVSHMVSADYISDIDNMILALTSALKTILGVKDTPDFLAPPITPS